MLLLALLLSAPLLLTAAGRAAAAPSLAGPVAAAPSTPSAPSSPAAAPSSPAASTDPDYPYLGYLRTTITGITPTVVTSSTGSSITVTGTMTNTGKGTLYDLRYVWQRGNALAGVTAIKAEIARPSRTAAVVGEDSRILGPTAPAASGAATQDAARQVDLAPGASAPFVATVDVGPGGLKINARGVYPLTIKVSGDIGQNGATQYERVGEIHLLGTVLSLPLPAVAAGALPSSGAQPSVPPPTAAAGKTADPVPATVLWPLVDNPHLGVDGVFLDDSLASGLAPGGRLSGVLSALDGFSSRGAAVTLVVDPQLLDEIEAMTGGYRVVAAPGAPQPPLTPTSTTPSSSSAAAASSASAAAPSAASSALVSGPHGSAPGGSGAGAAIPNTAASSGAVGGQITNGQVTAGLHPPAPTALPGPPTSARSTPPPPPAGTIAGTGQAAAAAFLTRLRAATRTHQVLVLPYSDPDSTAMMRAGLDDQLAALVTRGRTVATRVLQVQRGDPGLITDTLVPAGGAVNDATLAFLATHGISHAVLSPAAVEHAGGPVGAVRIAEPGGITAPVTAAVTDADVLARLTELVAKGRSAGLATRLTTAAALLAGGSQDRTGTPLVLLPDKRWTANAAGLGVLSTLLQTLATGQVVHPEGLPTLTAKATVPATVNYSPAAEAAELPSGYLARVVADNNSIAAVSASLVQSRSLGAPAPEEVMEPLRTALASVAAAALRSDLGYGGRILSTVGSTLDELRGQVSIVSQSPSTLAASTAPLLVTVRNELPYDVRVKVVVIDGASAGMTTKEPALEDIPAGGSHQFRIEASVVKAGRFQVHARIQAADGSTWSAPTTITVSSSAYGALTIVLVAVAGGALTLMVAVRLVQRVRHRGDPGSRSADADRPGASEGSGGPTAPEPDSILAAANESTRRTAPGSGRSGNPGGPGASDFPAGLIASDFRSPRTAPDPAGPTVASPFDEQGESPR